MDTQPVWTVWKEEEQGNKKRLSDDGRIESFVASQVLKRGLDERTARAYALDLRQVYRWLGQQQIPVLEEGAAEDYLRYLTDEKKRKPSTVIRTYRVLQYYLEYLFRQGDLAQHRAITPPETETPQARCEREEHMLSKAETDAFFAAMDREYESLDCGFRRRVCLRDRVMMELLFFHGIEISGLLRLTVPDFDSRTGLLTIRGKRGKKHQEYLFSRALKEKMGRWIEEHGYFEKGNEYDEVLFLSKAGKPLSMKMIILVFEKYRVMAGIEKEYTPKDLKASRKRYARELMVERCG